MKPLARCESLLFRRVTVIVALLVTACIVAGPLAGAGFSTSANKPAYVPDQVLITLRAGQSESVVTSFANRIGGSIAQRPVYSHTYAVHVPSSYPGQTGTLPADRVMAARTGLMRSYPGVQHVDYNCYRYPLATPNDEFYPSMPNQFDTSLLDGQWEMQPAGHIFAPEGWDLQKGSDRVVVAVIDTGVRDRFKIKTNKIVRIIHPDLQGRVLGGIDFGDTGSAETNNPGPCPSEDPNAGEATHGTHVAGTIAAQGDNWIGVCGLCWDKTWILPIKVSKDADDSLSSLAIIEGIYYAIQWRGTAPGAGIGSADQLRVGVINMSLGGPFPSDAEAQIISQAIKSGIVVVASAGNSWGQGNGAVPPGYPASYEGVIGVAASDYNDDVAFFSQQGHAVSIAAPGWAVLSTVWNLADATVDNEPNTPPSPTSISTGSGSAPNSTVFPVPVPFPTWPDKYGNGYDYFYGTSMSSPHVAGAAALLLSHGVPASDVPSILYQTATPKGLGRPNDAYGWGVLNVGAALRRASIETTISSPGKGAVVATLKPRFRIDFRHASQNSIRVWIDPIDTNGDGFPDNQATMGGSAPEISDWQKDYFTLDAQAGKTYLLFNYAVQPSRGVNGRHKVYVTADSDINFDTPPTIPVNSTDTTQFTVQPQTIGAGWRLFSIPASFATPQNPEAILGSSGMLARWNYTNNPFGEYALYNLDRSRTDDDATFTPISVFGNALVHPVSQPTGATPPAGLGYWLFTPSSTTIPLPEGAGQEVSDMPYVIGLYSGWNMVGNPFPFPVQWSNATVEYAGMRATAAEAVQNGWLADSIFRYDNTHGRYIYNQVASAFLMPWEAEWVRVKVRTPELAPAVLDAWADEFNSGVLDMTAPEPDWFVGATFGTATEAGGMLRLIGTAGQPAYVYVTDKDFPIYKDCIIDSKLVLANSGATVSGGPANAEIRFRTDGAGDGYSLSFKAGDAPNIVCLQRSDTGAIIQTMQVNHDLPSGTVLYVSITCVDAHIKISVGTSFGQADVAGWELNDSTFILPGSFMLVNDGMLDARWDYFRFRSIPLRLPDVTITVPPSAYTGSTQ